MKKIYQRIGLMLVFIITLVTSSGCFIKVGGGEPLYNGTVKLVSAPSTTTVRFMNEALYIGYLGAQRDFALIVDNASYTLNHDTQKCDSEGYGCASTMTKILMNYGIKAANFTGVSGSENVLLYYATAEDFYGFGNSSGDSWYKYLTGNSGNEKLSSPNNSSTTNDDFKNNDTILSLSCSSNSKDKSYICDYAKDLKENGYSDKIGNSMILLFHNGNFTAVIGDKTLDTDNSLNLSGTNFDRLQLSDSDDFSNYYNNMISKLKQYVIVSNATYTKATNTGSSQEIKNLTSIAELEAVVAKGGDYLLLITSSGFIDEKVGTNYYINSSGNEVEASNLVNSGDSELDKSISLLLNTVSTYTDNCASESEPMLNFLKSTLQALIAGGIGMLAGAAVGALGGSLLGSVIPGIGTAVGAVAGAIIGGIAGFFAGLKVNKDLENKLKSANGISNTSYCKIVSSALNDVEINVPIYTYNIDTAEKNIKDYNNGNNSKLDSELTAYYNSNMTKCTTQNTKVAVPSGVMSFFTDALNSKYNYADTCEKELVSQIVGSFGGAPSLLLFLNGEKADDLYGRVTTELVNEMLSVWGLKSIADLYIIESTDKLNNMSASFGSAQTISNASYCFSNLLVPTCDNSYYRGTISLNSTYVNSATSDKGINIDYTSLYKDYSKDKNAGINSNKFTLNGGDAAKYYVKLPNEFEIITNSETLPEDSQFKRGILLEAIRKELKDNSTNIYTVKYNDIYYIIGEKFVVGYKLVSDEPVIVYYYSNNIEYFFPNADADFDESNIRSNYINAPAIINNSSEVNNISVSSAYDDLYLYITYTIGDDTVYYVYIA